MISHSTIERIKDLPVHDVISHYVDLKKAGATWKAKSPFSDEKSASFFVVPSKNIFKDFSSGKGGNAITFVMEYTGKSFPDAVKEIAEKCNERIEYDELSEEDQNLALDRELLYRMNEAAAKRYAGALLELDATHLAYQELIDKRRYTADTLLQWQVGYAPGDTDGYKPNAWRFLTELIGDKNYQAGIELGLIVQKKGHTYDFFRHRVMYPIHNHHGRIVAFGGRALRTDEYNAKYLNSADSKVYQKEATLYGLHFAHKPIHDSGFAFLMEGYTDVISFHQAGYANSVGTCGTALTPNQCKLLRRYTSKVVLLRDGDAAGQKATLRDITTLFAHGFEVTVLPVPEFEDGRKVDPDDMTRMFNV